MVVLVDNILFVQKNSDQVFATKTLSAEVVRKLMSVFLSFPNSLFYEILPYIFPTNVSVDFFLSIKGYCGFLYESDFLLRKADELKMLKPEKAKLIECFRNTKIRLSESNDWNSSIKVSIAYSTFVENTSLFSMNILQNLLVFAGLIG